MAGMSSLERSRPLRAAAEATGRDEHELAGQFARRRVLIRLEDRVADDVGARETFLYAVNQTLRFCPNVSISVPPAALELIAETRALAVGINGPDAVVPLVADDPEVDMTLIVGIDVAPMGPSVVVNSSGWVARMTTSASRITRLPKALAPPNAIGALAAACLGVAQVFHVLAGESLTGEPIELSLFERTDGAFGTLPVGPPLPATRLELDALLVGCGGVMHGFAYAVKRLPVSGRARAVDRQRLRSENIGPYVLASHDLVGVEKAEIVRAALAPTIAVTAYAEDFDPLFTVRLERGHFPLPPIVVAGLDRVTTRHTVQRLWPELLIDMGAGGETAQVVLKRRNEPGLCVLEALTIPPAEQDDVARLAADSGLSDDAIREMDRPVTADDVAAAPPDRRDALEVARRRRLLRCGFIRTRALDHEEVDQDFAAAAPFVVAYSGVVAAAELVKELMGVNARGSLRYQLSFASGRCRAVSPAARHDCECQAARDLAA